MRIRDLKYYLLTFLILMFVCAFSQTKSKVFWTEIDHFENKPDSSLYERVVYKNSIEFRYFFDFEDTSSFLDFELLKENLLVVAKQDTIELHDIQKLKYKLDSIEILKFEFPDTPPGGQGCWLFSRKLGMVGMGLYVGGKLIISKINAETFNPIVISELLKEKLSEPPPPLLIQELIHIDKENEE